MSAVAKKLVLIAAILGLAFGCDNSEFEVLRASIEREQNPQVEDGDLKAMRDGNVKLGLNLLKLLAENTDDNLAVSPLSIRGAFGMLYAASAGRTESDIAESLGFLSDQARTHHAMNHFDLALMARNMDGTEEDEPVIVATANRLFARENLSFEDSYLETLALNYGAGVHLANFQGQPDAERQKINDWVEERTHGRIVDLFSKGSITEDTKWVLANAIYLKAPWLVEFQEQSTRDEVFTRLDGTQIKVPTMQACLYGSFVDGEDYKMIELDLRGKDLSVTFILPASGKFGEVQERLTVENLDAMWADADHGDMNVWLPKFEIKTGTFKLNAELQEIGMVTPFSTEADFSGFGQWGQDTQISSVIHSVFVSAHEIGIEAAGATAIDGDADDYPEIDFDAHRPFIFIIRDEPTGLVLFAGRVMDPR